MKFKYVILIVMMTLFTPLTQAGLFDPPLLNHSFEEESSWSAPTPGWNDYDDEQSEWWAFQEEEGDLTNFPDADGSVWGALRPGGIHWQQIGTWDKDIPYRIQALVGNRDTWTNGGIIISLWVGGDAGQAGDDTTPTIIGATKIAESVTLITDNVGAWDDGPDDEKKEVETILSTGTGYTPGDPIWIQIVNANMEGISYFDNVRISDARKATKAPSSSGSPIRFMG